MKKIGIPLEGFAQAAAEAAKEGAVLLRNEDHMLPIGAEEKISLFGRCQIDYYRSGTGSGGMVQVPYTTNLLDSLREKSKVVNEKLAGVYEAWIQEHPFDNGGGSWASEPWNQAEMPIEERLVKEARTVSEKAIVVIGRTAGEDQDNADISGSLRLTEAEEQLLMTVNASFDQVAVIFNMPGIINMDFLENEKIASHIKALMYVWHGGMEGGNAAADLLLGNAVPSGKLPDTIAARISDYPSAPYYGGRERNLYVEDIYVGYRYFETFHPEQVLYEFGYGLSYTDFAISTERAEIKDNQIQIKVTVQNIGKVYQGKEVVQVYYEAPQGKLGQPARQLLAYGKTALLEPGASQELTFAIDIARMKTYDDSGSSGERSSYVMEAGEYHIYVGSSIRQTKKVLTYVQESLAVVETLTEALAPYWDFPRMKPGIRREDGTYEVSFEKVPARTVSLGERIQEHLPAEIPWTGNKGILLQDVKAGKATLDAFVAQLTKEELTTLVRAEGMDHPHVTAGTAAAFGGVGESLSEYGIPLGCAADGPSGIRMGADYKATQVPIGTLLAASFNDEMVEQLYVLEGKELLRNEIDTLLGPGMNIHRNPLNGRNFEYFSEDPLLTGNMASAVLRGIAEGGASGTVKHFACNNQETGRTLVDSVVSERAVREIYLRGFEIAVKEGGAQSIMTSYNPVNGHWAASNYDLNTTILRKEWGFEGIVMTDWWAKMNNVEEGGPSDERSLRDMVRSGNDLYMVVNNFGAEANSAEDNLPSSLAAGTLTVGELQERAKNICGFLMNTQALHRPRKPAAGIYTLQPLASLEEGQLPMTVLEETGADSDQTLTAALAVEMGKTAYLQVKTPGVYNVLVHMMSVDFNTAQVACEFYGNDMKITNIAARGSEGRWMSQKLIRMDLQIGFYSFRVEEAKPNLIVDGIRFERVKQ